MSTIINATTTNGVVIQPDNSGSLVLQTNSGTTALTISTAQNATFAGTVTLPTGTVYPLVSSTAVASTSGTSIDFTSIPSWVKRITVMFSGVSINGTTTLIVQLGDSGGIETSGYLGTTAYFGTSQAGATVTTGMPIGALAAADTIHGIATISLLTSTTWSFSSTTSQSNGAYCYAGASSKSLSDILDRIRLTTTNGTSLFDAGSINILYE